MRKTWVFLAALAVLVGVFWAQGYWADSRYGVRTIDAPFDSNTLVVTAVRVPFEAMYGRPMPQGLVFATFYSGNSTKIGFGGLETSGIFSSQYDSIVGYQRSGDKIYVYAHVPSGNGWYEVDIGDVNNPMSRMTIVSMLVPDSRISSDAGVSNTVEFVRHIYWIGKLVVVEGVKEAQDVVLVYKYPVSGAPVLHVEHGPNLFVGHVGDWLFVGINPATSSSGSACVEQVNVNTGEVYCDSISGLSFSDIAGRTAFEVHDGVPYFATAAINNGSLTVREFKFSTPSGGRQYSSVSLYKSTSIRVPEGASLIGFVAGPNNYIAFVKSGSSSIWVYHISPADLSVVHQEEWTDSYIVNSPYYVFGSDPNGVGVSVGYLSNNSGRFYFEDDMVPDGNYAYSENVSVVSGEVNSTVAVVDYRICNISDVNMPGYDVARVYLRVSDQNSSVYYYYIKYLPFKLSAGTCKDYIVRYTPDSLTFSYPSSGSAPKEFNSSYTYEARIYVLHEQPYNRSASGFSDYGSQQISFTSGPVSIVESSGSSSSSGQQAVQSVAVSAPPSTVTSPSRERVVQPASPVVGPHVNYGAVVLVAAVLLLLAYVARVR